MLHRNIYNDGVKTERFINIPEKYHKLYKKFDCEQKGNDFIANLNARYAK